MRACVLQTPNCFEKQQQTQSDTPQSELNIPTPAPHRDRCIKDGVIHIEMMSPGDEFSFDNDTNNVSRAVLKFPVSTEKSESHRIVIFNSPPVNNNNNNNNNNNTYNNSNMESHIKQVGVAGNSGSLYSCLLSVSPSPRRRRLFSDFELLETPHRFYSNLCSTAGSPQEILHTVSQINNNTEKQFLEEKYEEHKEIKDNQKEICIASPTPKKPKDIKTTTTTILYESSLQRQQRSRRLTSPMPDSQKEGKLEEKKEGRNELSIPTPLPYREIKRRTHNFVEDKENINPPKENKLELSPPQEVLLYKQKEQTHLDIILCPESETLNDNLLFSHPVKEDSKSEIQIPHSREAIHILQVKNEKEEEKQEKRPTTVDVAVSPINCNKNNSIILNTSTLSVNTSAPMLVNWHAVMEESIAVDVTVEEEEIEVEVFEEEEETKEKEKEEESYLPQKSTLSVIANNTEDSGLQRSTTQPPLLFLSNSYGSVASWPPSIYPVQDYSLDVNPNYDINNNNNNNFNFNINNHSDNNSHNEYKEVKVTQRDVVVRNLLCTLTSPNLAPPSVSVTVSPLLERKERILGSKKLCENYDSEASLRSLALNLCRIVRPFARNLLLLLTKESDGSGFVTSDTCAEAVNNILEIEKISNMRATRHLCRYINIIGNDISGNNEEVGDSLSYANFVSNVVQLAEVK